MSADKGDLYREEDEAWGEFWGVAEALPRETLTADGTWEAWSAKDVLAHVGSWHAASSVMLERIRMGTYGGWDDGAIEALNREWWEAWRAEDLDSVLVHLHSSRARVLEELDRMPDDLLGPDAVDWFRESGAPHYREHLPALQGG